MPDHIRHDRRHQERILKDFRDLYFSAKLKTNGHQETIIPQLKQGRETVTVVDALLREELALTKQLLRIGIRIEKANANHQTMSIFLPCFRKASKNSLLEAQRSVELRLLELDSWYKQHCQDVFELYCISLVLVDRLQNPAPSRASSLAPALI